VLIKIGKVLAEPQLNIHWKDRKKIVSLQLPDVLDPLQGREGRT
jgi:hypothetical protein